MDFIRHASALIMTEENQDSKTPKLRLSRQADDAQPKETKPEKIAAPKPDLQLKRPGEGGAQAQPTPKDPLETKPEPQDEADFDPENPFQGITDTPKKEYRDAAPPELPSRPASIVSDGSGEKLEEAIKQIGDEAEEKKSMSGLLTSLVIIFILIAILGGTGYGLYYVLKSPGESGEPSSAKTSETTDTEGDSGGFLSGSITKAKAAITKKTGNDASAAEDADLAEELAPSVQTAEDATAEATKTTETTKTAETAKTNQESAATATESSVAEFLKTAHIGGVRTGERALLILNGESYKKGDLIHPEYGLRFIGFRDEKLAFRDDKGIIYIKSF